MKIIFASIFLVFTVACALMGTSVDLDKDFTLKKNETAQVKGVDLKIKMVGNGTSQMVSGGDEVFCKFEVTRNGKTEGRSVNVGKSAKFGDLSVKIVKVDTTADPKATDPWSTTSCSFIVSKAGK